MRLLYVTAGWVAVGLGAIGAVLPLLPTTPFVLLAAFCFAKGSPQARAWLVDRSPFGPHITAWEERGAIARRAKLMAVAMMGAVLLASVIFDAPGWVIAVQAAVMGPVAVFLWTRPEA